MACPNPDIAAVSLPLAPSEVPASSENPRSSFLWKLWLAAFLVRLLGVGFGLLFFPAWLLPPDTQGLYYPIARSLSNGAGYQANGDFVEASRSAPILPCWLAVLMWCAGSDLPLWLPGLFNAAFRAASVILVYLLARRAFGHRIALFSAIIYLLDPWEAFWAGFVMKEPLAVPLFLLAVWQLCRFEDQRSVHSAITAGVAVGLATLARFPSLALWGGAVFLGVLTVLQRKNSVPLRKAGLNLACLTIALLVTLSPWLVRNWQVLGQPVLTPHFAGQKFYTGNGPGIERPTDGYYSPKGIDHALLQEAHREKPPWQREKHLFSTTLQYMLSHPGETLDRMISKCVNMWRPTFGESSLRNWLLLGIPYCLWMIVSLTGIALAVRMRTMPPGLSIPLILYFCVHLVFWGEIRNRQYLTPLLFVFGGLALEHVFRRARQDRLA
jgi:4-amino-4-deoxy-L-arabinose transferase-like glycosyltransferase